MADWLEDLHAEVGGAVAEAEPDWLDALYAEVSPNAAEVGFGAAIRAPAQFAADLLKAPAAARGALEGVGVPEGVTALAFPGVAHEPLRAAGEALEGMAQTPGAAAHPTAALVGGAVGSGAAYLTAGAPIAASLRAIGLGSRAAAVLSGAMLGSPQRASSMYFDAQAAGASPENQMKALFAGSFIGSLEGVGGLFMALGRMNVRSGGLVYKILAPILDTGDEALQEATSEALENLAAQHLYDEDRELLEGVPESALGGGVAGAVFSVLLGALPGRMDTPEFATPEEVAAAKAADVQPDPSGSGALAGAGEAQEGVGTASAQRRRSVGAEPLPIPEPFLERNRGAAAKPDLEVRSVAPESPTELWAQEFVEQRGRRLVLAEADQPLGLPAMFDPETGNVVLERGRPEDMVRGLVFHEVAHALRQQAGAAWEGLYGDLARLDQQGLQTAEADYAARWAQQTGRELTPDARREEGASFYVETIQDWLSQALEDPGRFERIVAQARTQEQMGVVRRVLGALADVLDRITGGRFRSLAGDLRRAAAELRTDDPARAAEIALTVRRAFDSIRGLPPSLEEQGPVLPSAEPGRGVPERVRVPDEGLEAPAPAPAAARIATPRKRSAAQRARDRAVERGSLQQFIRARGGISYHSVEGPEIHGRFSDKELGSRGTFGLGPVVHGPRSRRGNPWDRLLAEAVEEGFFPGRDARDISYAEFFEALDNDIRRPADYEGGEPPFAVRRRRRYEEGEEERFAAAWHGSAAEFDEFSDEFIGTGEGAQAFGWGHYLGGRREVGEYYKKQLAGRKSTAVRFPKETRDDATELVSAYLNDQSAGLGDNLDTVERYIGGVREHLEGARWETLEELREAYRKEAKLQREASRSHDPIMSAIDREDAWVDAMELELALRLLDAGHVTVKLAQKGHLYRVDLAPEEDEYLLWDKPLSEQSEKVKEALQSVGRDFAGEEARYRDRYPSGGLGERLGSNIYKQVGSDLQDAGQTLDPPRSADRAASETLRAAGIRGIKYLEGASRAKGEGSYNYVVFDPKDISIEERFAVAPPEPDDLGFFSQLEATLESKIQGKRATAQQVRALVDPKKGNVKAEELEWSGLLDWLGDRKHVSKEDLLAFVRENNVRVQEVRSGADPDTPAEEPSDLHLTRGSREYVEPPDGEEFDAETAEETYDVYVEDTEDTYTIVGSDWAGSWWVNEIPEAQGAPWQSEYDAEQAIRDHAWDVLMRRVRAGGGQFAPRFNQPNLVLPGGENYREVLLTLPGGRARAPDTYSIAPHADGGWVIVNDRTGVGQAPIYEVERDARERAQEMTDEKSRSGYLPPSEQAFTSSHFDEPNVLAHVRLNDRTDAEGNRVLFVEEVQSDWHQEGRKKGYGTGTRYVIYDTRDDTTAAVFTTREAAEEAIAQASPGADVTIHPRFAEIREEEWQQGVPDAPFKTSWHELALKRVIRMAAEEGYDAVAWTTGAQQVERYETTYRAVVDEIKWTTRPGPSTKFQTAGPSVAAFKGGAMKLDVDFDENGVAFGGNEEHIGQVRGKTVEEIFGKEIARRILSEDSGSVSGEGLTIGGKGMEGFYDKMLPATANKIGKRFGARVGEAKIESDPRPDEVVAETGPLPRAQEYEVQDIDGNQGGFRTWGEARSWALREIPDAGADLGRWRIVAHVPAAPTTVHSLPITEDMRATVMERGFPRFAVGPVFELADETRTDALIRLHVNRMRRFVTGERAVEAQGGTVSEQASVALAETLLPGRGGARLADLRRGPQRKLLRGLRRSGISKEDFERYLYARHAPDRNEVHHQREPTKWGHEASPGSGMRTSEAERTVAQYEALSESYERLAEQYDAINRRRLDWLVEYGLLTEAERDGWVETYGPHYVPLKTQFDPENQYLATGRGIRVSGPESKRSKGRKSMAGEILAETFAQAELAIIRGEKNRVWQSLRQLVLDNPSPNLWEVYTEPKDIPLEDREEGRVFTGKVDGVEERVVLRDAKLARAMNQLSVQVGPIVGRISQLARIMSMLHTSLNYEFIPTNFFRDLQTAAVHLTADQSAAAAIRVQNPVRLAKAWKGMFKQVRNPEARGEWEGWARRFRNAGGQTGWASADSLEQRIKGLEKVIQKSGFNAAIGATLELISDLNDATENGVRLSTFREMVEQGHSEDRAAQVAKDLTVNFNQRGELSSAFNAFKLFWNAGVQGNYRMVKTLAKPASPAGRRTWAMAASMTGAAMLLSYLNRIWGGEDDDGQLHWDKIQTHERERTAVVMLPGGRKLKMPLPYGYNVFWVLGTSLERALATDENAATAAKETALASLGSFSPIGRPATLGQAISPWFLEPFVQLGENKNWLNRPIMPPADPYARVPTPRSQRYYPSVNPLLREATDALHKITGGTDTEPGLIEISPEDVEHIMAAAAGGAGASGLRLLDTAERAVTDKPLEINRFPILRRFLGEPWPTRHIGEYYDHLRDVERADKAWKAAKDPADRRRVREEFLPLLRLRDTTKNFERQRKKLRDAILSAEGERKEKLKTRLDDLMKKYNRKFVEVTTR